MNIQNNRRTDQFVDPKGNDFHVPLERAFQDMIVKIQKSTPTFNDLTEPRTEPFHAEKLALQTDSSATLSTKIKDAMSYDIDPEKSLAEIRAILVGPLRRLHEARVEELVSILEENDRSTRNTFTALDTRLANLTAICDRLIAASDEAFKSARSDSSRFEAELQRQAETHNEKLAQHAGKLNATEASINEKFDRMVAEISQLIDNLKKTSALGTDHLQKEISDLVQANLMERSKTDMLHRQFEDRLADIEVHSEKLNLRNAEVFSQGFSDLAQRFLNIRSSHIN